MNLIDLDYHLRDKHGILVYGLQYAESEHDQDHREHAAGRPPEDDLGWVEHSHDLDDLIDHLMAFRLIDHLMAYHNVPGCFDPNTDDPELYGRVKALHNSYHETDPPGANFGQVAEPHDVTDFSKISLTRPS